MKRSAKPNIPSAGKAPSGPAGFGGLGSSSKTTLSYITPPPDLSNIPQDIIVPFKNLLKKDSITKAKALEDLVAYVKTCDEGPDEPVLDAWAHLYARISIDNSRRVRELSHNLLFELMNSARKRMEKRVPSMVGPWLAGTFDRDRAVSRAASDGLKTFLDTKEKEIRFWARCKTKILDYATEAMRETPDTLSDERSVTKEDALAKFHRVAGGSLSLVVGLVNRLEMGDIDEGLARYLKEEAVWSQATAGEAFVRRALYQLLQTLLVKDPEFLRPRLSQIGKILVSDSLKCDQNSSATALLRVLIKLTEAFPEVWGTKTDPLQRLRPFVERGSQGGSHEYWQELGRLLVALPDRSIPTGDATSFLKSMRIGILNRTEPRANAEEAWTCYVNTFERFATTLATDVSFVQQNFYPLTQRYLLPTDILKIWACPDAISLLPEVWATVASHPNPEIRQSVDDEWQKLHDAFLSRIKNSLPTVSVLHEDSQKAIAHEGRRWFTFVGAILELHQSTEQTGRTSTLRNIVTRHSSAILQEASQLLSRRSYKPFGVSSVLETAFDKCPEVFDEDVLFATLFPIREPEKLEDLVISPSLSRLFHCLGRFAREKPSRFQAIWVALVDASLKSSLTPFVPVKVLVSYPADTQSVQRHERLQEFLASSWKMCAAGLGSPSSWDLCDSTLNLRLIPDSSWKNILSNVVQQLGTSEDTGPVLKALELVARHQPSLVSQDQDVHVDLITKLLTLSELQDKVDPEQAGIFQVLIDQKSTEEPPLVGVIQQNLMEAGPSSLGVDILIQQAISTFHSGTVPLENLFPSPQHWRIQLSSFLQKAPSRSLALVGNMKGAYFLVKPGTDAVDLPHKRDSKGRSVPARMALYTAKLLSSGIAMTSLSEPTYVQLLYLMSLTAELAADHLAAVEDDGLWELTEGEIHMAHEAEKFITLSHTISNDVLAKATDWRENGLRSTTTAGRLANLALQGSRDLSPRSLYSSKTLCGFLQTLIGKYGCPARLDEWFSNQGIMKATPNTVFSAMACMVGFGESLVKSDAVKTLCNRLVGDMIGAFPGIEKTLLPVVLLNGCMSVYEPGRIPVEPRKQVMALKQMTMWTDTQDEMTSGLAAETCKGILLVLPAVKGVFGPYWQQIVDFIMYLWRERSHRDSVDDRLPYLHASMKLAMALADEVDRSDDLVEALQKHAEVFAEALVGLLKLPTKTITRPVQITSELLRKLVDRTPLEQIGDVSDLYPLIGSYSVWIQTATFGILHRAVPEAQKQLSVDILLEGKSASLPDKLLSLLSKPPTLEAYSDVLEEFPTEIRGYLLAWHLVFDSYSTASARVRGDYSECLKKQELVGPFLTFMFDVLGHSAGNELNLDKEKFTEGSIRSYDIGLANNEEDERNLHWILIHLFYLTLKYIPGLFRVWYINCENKQTKNALKPWMTKYFSPHIIADELEEVVRWAANQEDPADDEKELVVKVSRAAREVTAEYEVDEEVASLLIRVPPEYPLESVQVVGVKRVAVDERTWESWLLTTQGVIKFGSGGIPDGLSAFRRNIVGKLKGQTECAICYSIVSSDKKLPDKKCETCRHWFHGVCLYKWFQNSGRNSCPLCRNPIDMIVGSNPRQKNVA